MTCTRFHPDADGAAATEHAVVFLLTRLTERPRAATARALVHQLAALTECAPTALPSGRRALYARLLARWRGELAALRDEARRPGRVSPAGARGADVRRRIGLHSSRAPRGRAGRG